MRETTIGQDAAGIKSGPRGPPYRDQAQIQESRRFFTLGSLRMEYLKLGPSPLSPRTLIPALYDRDDTALPPHVTFNNYSNLFLLGVFPSGLFLFSWVVLIVRCIPHCPPTRRLSDFFLVVLHLANNLKLCSKCPYLDTLYREVFPTPQKRRGIAISCARPRGTEPKILVKPKQAPHTG